MHETGMTRERLTFLSEQALQLALMSLLLVVPLVFFTPAHDVFEYNKLTAFRIFTLLGLFAFLTRTLLAGRPAWRFSPLLWPVLMVGLSSLLSTLRTNNPAVSVFGVYEDFEGILTMANYLLLWFLVNQHVRNLGDVRKFLAVVVLAGTLAASYGLLQNFGFDFVPWNPNTYSAGRLFGTLGNPNFLAAYLLMTLPIALVWFWITPRFLAKAGMLLAVLLMLICIFFTKSRGAMYALAVQALVLGAYLLADHLRSGTLWRSNRRWMLALLLLAASSLLLPSVRQTMSLTLSRTLAVLNVKEIKITPRLYIWRSALQMIRDHPFIGSGLDTFQITFPKYRLAEYWRLEWNGTPEKAHNFFLQIGATTGLLGLGAWLWLIAAFFAIAWRQIWSLPPPRQHLALGLAVAQLGFLVQNQFNFTVVAYGSLFWFFLALGPALGRDEARPQVLPGEGEPFSLAGLKLSTWLAYILGAGLILMALIFSLRVWTADIFFKRGIIGLSIGNPEAAVPNIGQAVALDSQREIYWVKLGIAYEEAAKRAPQKEQKEVLLEKAAQIHKHTIGMNPLNGYDFNNLGRVYKYWGDYINRDRLKEAEEACKKATELDPYNVYFALDLASVYLSQGRGPETRAIVERLVSIFPDFAIPYSYLGYLRLLEQDDEGAARYLRQASELNWRGDINTQASTWSNLGIVRARKSELEGAAAAFRRALELRPQYLEARLNLAVILERLGQPLAAAAEYRQILNEAPQYPQAGVLQKKIEFLERGKR